MLDAGVRTDSFDFSAYPLGVSLRRLEDDSELREAGLHERRYISVLLVTGGQGEHRQGGQEWVDVGRGDLFVVAPGELLDASGLAEATGWSMGFVSSAVGGAGGPNEVRLPHPGDPIWLIAVRGVCLLHRHRLDDDDVEAFDDRLRQLDAELRDPRPSQRAAVSALATLVVVDIGRVAFPELAAAPSVQHRAVIDAFAFIEEHFAEPISLDDVAPAVARSTGDLARLMRRLTGRSVNEWILERRMAEARRLLAETTEPVQDVGAQVGFPDPEYFRDRFKRIHGRAPQAWRTLCQEPPRRGRVGRGA